MCKRNVKISDIPPPTGQKKVKCRSGGSRPSDKGGGGGGGGGGPPPPGGGGGGGGGGLGGHPHPEIRGGWSQKKCFRPFGPQFGLKISGELGPPGPSPESATVSH